MCRDVVLRHGRVFVFVVDRHFASLDARAAFAPSVIGALDSPGPANPPHHPGTRAETDRNCGRNRVGALAQRGKRTRQNVGCAAACVASGDNGE